MYDYPDYQDALSTHNIFYPASDPNVICVGATAYKTGYYNFDGVWVKDDWGSGGEVGSYSSRGPTLAGHIKPEVLAPGTNIVAAFNSFYTEMNPDYNTAEYDVSRYTFRGRDYAWGIMSGTSMACPIVAGIIAQWMEAVPTLTREQVLEVFEATCHRRNPSLSYPNNDYGYGEIDAEAGLNYLMDVYTGIIETTDNRQRTTDIYNLAGQKVGEDYKGIVIINGRKELRK